MYDFVSAYDKQPVDSIFASNETIAINIFMARLGNRRLLHDIIVLAGSRVIAVISNRGNARPDVMILDYMRAQITGRTIRMPAPQPEPEPEPQPETTPRRRRKTETQPEETPAS